MKKYFCNPCGYTYDPEKGDPEHGIAPGTAFEDIPDDWVCPICGIDKSMFQPCIDNYNQSKNLHHFQNDGGFQLLSFFSKFQQAFPPFLPLQPQWKHLKKSYCLFRNFHNFVRETLNISYLTAFDHGVLQVFAHILQDPDCCFSSFNSPFLKALCLIHHICCIIISFFGISGNCCGKIQIICGVFLQYLCRC